MKKYILDTNIASLLGGEETDQSRKIYEKFYQLDDEDDGIFEKLSEIEPKFKYENWLN